ncbi:MAG: iron-containing alcohol dehydrogenase, partial [Parasporobacterium sp.]|nr:iron-containing alcohol dehydrogenase [Parasporobacterium sp.]
ASPFPKLRGKALLCCIPSTSGTASEVSRSFVISGDDGMKHGLGNMEMMPDIAICDPEVTVSMPAHITAETGMDAMTHAVEALVSNRANYVSDILAIKAIEEINEYLPVAYADGNDINAREHMLNASMIAGMAFTNVSLGIVHSMAHTVGSLFHVAHGLADAVILPYIMKFNSEAGYAAEKYSDMASKLEYKDMIECISDLNRKVNIPETLAECIPDEAAYMAALDEMAKCALADGCTKTNPIIPTIDQLKELFILVYHGK